MPVPKKESPSKRMLMRDAVYERLLDLIISGQLVPNEVLNDAELEAWAGASRTPVREALNKLADMGLVVIAPQAKTRVAPLEPHPFLEAVELQCILGQEVIKQVWPLLTDPDRQRLVEISMRLGAPTAEHQSWIWPEVMTVMMERYQNEAIARLITKYSPLIQRAIAACGRDVADVRELNLAARDFAQAAAGTSLEKVLESYHVFVEQFSSSYSAAIGALQPANA